MTPSDAPPFAQIGPATKRDPAPALPPQAICGGVMEDDADLRRLFCHALAAEHVAAKEFATAAEAIFAASSGKIDFLLLDLGLGTENGLQIIEDLRQVSSLPIVVISGKTDAEVVCAALDAGADNYLRKPVTIAELRARIRGIVRRFEPLLDSLPTETFMVDGVTFNLSRGMAHNAHGFCKFTDREIIILQCLFREPRTAVSRDAFARAIFGQRWDPNVRILDVHIANIRAKLGNIGAPGTIIRTRRNIGYAVFPDR
jgi:DNA-binding response OmpR family regulator